MIISKTIKEGPSSELTFEGPEKSMPITGVTIYGKAWQDGTPTVDNPVEIQYVGPTAILVTVQAGGSTKQINLPVSAGLKGLKYIEREYKYLVGNGAYLTTQDGARLLAK